MSLANFKACLEFTLSWEGGYSNDPKDPGGETRFGISKRYHKDTDIKNLTREQAEAIYFSEYWLGSDACLLPWPYCLAVFDAAVNPGIGACRMFKRDAETDPSKSPFTKALIICNSRQEYFNRQVLKFPEKKRFINGWINRINSLRKSCANPAP